MTLGYSRSMFAEAALDQKLGTLHEEAFRQLGGVPPGDSTVWLGTDERGEIVWNPMFVDFARYWGFKPRLCRPYRAQSKGKVEAGVKYLRRNFLFGLQGREPGSLIDFNIQLRVWAPCIRYPSRQSSHEGVLTTRAHAFNTQWFSSLQRKTSPPVPMRITS